MTLIMCGIKNRSLAMPFAEPITKKALLIAYGPRDDAKGPIELMMKFLADETSAIGSFLVLALDEHA